MAELLVSERLIFVIVVKNGFPEALNLELLKYFI